MHLDRRFDCRRSRRGGEVLHPIHILPVKKKVRMQRNLEGEVMHSFRLRLALALIAGVTLLSVASTYFEVLAHKHALRQDLEWRSSWMGVSLKPEIERA